MRLAVLTIAVLLATAAHASPLGDADKADIDSVILADIGDQTYDGQFQCPESFRTAEERMDEFTRFTTWAHLRHPDWSFRKRLDVRLGLLRRHNCAATLAKVTDSQAPAFPSWAYPPRK